MRSERSGDLWVGATRGDVLGLPLTEVTSLQAAAELLGSLMTSATPCRALLVSFANPVSLKLIGRNPGYVRDLRSMDLVFSDGIALTLAARWLTGRAWARASFDSGSLAPAVWQKAAEERWPIALVGSRPGVAAAAAARLRRVWPAIHIVATLSGYGDLPSIVARTVACSPSIVVCGMGMPRQEAFLVALAKAGWRGYGFTCGGYLDQLAERFNYYPELINRWNLRWLYRLTREPFRIGRRCCTDYPPFAGVLLRTLLTR